MTRGRLFGTMLGTVFLVNMARVVFAPLLSEFITVFDITAGTAGLIATLVWIGSATLRLPTGWVLTYVPRHHVVLVAGGVLTVAATFVAVAESVTVLMVGAIGMGLASGAYFVAGNPLVSELYPDRVGRVMGIHGMASQLAAVVAAPFVTVVLAVQIQLFAGWQAVFALIAVASAVVTTVLFFVARSTDLPDAGTEDRDLLGAARTEWRTVGTGVAIIGLTGFVWQGVFNFYELYMVAKGVPESVGRNLLTVIFGAGVPAFLVSGRLADRFPHVPYMLGILGAFVVCLFVLVNVSGLVPLLLISVVLGYVIHSLFPAMDTYLLDTMPDETRGSAYSVYSATMMVVQATGSSAVGTLRDAGYAFDTIYSIAGVGLAGILGALIVFWWSDLLPE